MRSLIDALQQYNYDAEIQIVAGILFILILVIGIWREFIRLSHEENFLRTYWKSTLLYYCICGAFAITILLRVVQYL